MRKKWNKYFRPRKGFIACPKLMINELARSPTRSGNIYYANNEQTSIAVFIAVFCFTHAEHNLIKLHFDGEINSAII